MTSEPTFDELLQAAPRRAATAKISIVGKLFQGDEDGGFTMVTGDGASLTLKSTDVQGHALLGYDGGQAVVRIDVDSAALPEQGTGAQPFSLATGGGVPEPLQMRGSGALGDVGTVPTYDVAWTGLPDTACLPAYDVIHGHASGTLGDVGTVHSYDVVQGHHSGTLGDVGTPPSYEVVQGHHSGTLGDVGTPPSYEVVQGHHSGTLGDVGTPPSYEVVQGHASGTLGDVGTVHSYDVA